MELENVGEALLDPPPLPPQPPQPIKPNIKIR